MILDRLCFEPIAEKIVASPRLRMHYDLCVWLKQCFNKVD